MRAFLVVLAVLGALAVLRRLGAGLLRALGRTAESVVARQSLETRAARGDLTGVAEATAWREQSRRLRRNAFLTTGLWAAVLLAPIFTSWTLVTYAACSVLWLLPPRALRRPPIPGPPTSAGGRGAPGGPGAAGAPGAPQLPQS